MKTTRFPIDILTDYAKKDEIRNINRNISWILLFWSEGWQGCLSDNGVRLFVEAVAEDQVQLEVGLGGRQD